MIYSHELHYFFISIFNARCVINGICGVFFNTSLMVMHSTCAICVRLRRFIILIYVYANTCVRQLTTCSSSSSTSTQNQYVCNNTLMLNVVMFLLHKLALNVSQCFSYMQWSLWLSNWLLYDCYRVVNGECVCMRKRDRVINKLWWHFWTFRSQLCASHFWWHPTMHTMPPYG